MSGQLQIGVPQPPGADAPIKGKALIELIATQFLDSAQGGPRAPSYLFAGVCTFCILTRIREKAAERGLAITSKPKYLANPIYNGRQYYANGRPVLFVRGGTKLVDQPKECSCPKGDD